MNIMDVLLGASVGIGISKKLAAQVDVKTRPPYSYMALQKGQSKVRVRTTGDKSQIPLWGMPVQVGRLYLHTSSLTQQH